MTVLVKERYISEEDCKKYIEFLDLHSYPGQGKIVNALGYESSLAASKINEETGVIPGDPNPINKDLGALFEQTKKYAEEVFGCELDLCQANYQNLLTGAFNPLHADATRLDGTPIHDNEIPQELEWSGLIYLNTQGEDFEGGDIYFPEFDLSYSPKAGDLLLFKGDVEHRHGVHEVTAGNRKNIVLFWANKGNVSGFNFFDVDYNN